MLTPIKHIDGAVIGGINWLFKCDCGNDYLQSLRAVKIGRVKSCGCLRDRKHYYDGKVLYRCSDCMCFYEIEMFRIMKRDNNPNNVCRACEYERVKKYRKKNHDFRKKAMERANNRVRKRLSTDREYRERHLIRQREAAAIYRKRHKDKIQKRQKKHYIRTARDLSGCYVKSIITSKIDIARDDIPTEMIELKREELLLFRKLKQAKEALNGHDSN